MSTSELVWTVDGHDLGKVEEDRQVTIAIGRSNEALPNLRLQVVLAHQTPDLLVVHNNAAMAQCGPHPSISISLKGARNLTPRHDERGVSDDDPWLIVVSEDLALSAVSDRERAAA